jgi:hypothetical protein
VRLKENWILNVEFNFTMKSIAAERQSKLFKLDSLQIRDEYYKFIQIMHEREKCVPPFHMLKIDQI